MQAARQIVESATSGGGGGWWARRRSRTAAAAVRVGLVELAVRAAELYERVPLTAFRAEEVDGLIGGPLEVLD